MKEEPWRACLHLDYDSYPRGRNLAISTFKHFLVSSAVWESPGSLRTGVLRPDLLLRMPMDALCFLWPISQAAALSLALMACNHGKWVLTGSGRAG